MKEMDASQVTSAGPKPGGQGMWQHVVREIHVLQSLRHENVVRLERVFAQDATVQLVMEHCRGGCLAQMLINNPERKFSVGVTRMFMRQLLTGLDFLQRRQLPQPTSF